ncbi:hypothetical protein Slin14017_G124620 [Septoria linicola]|nr:hypothetical protein Slin14017_G124620 [Septoria linicola]
MAGIKELELRFRKIHPGHSPAPIHKISGSSTQAQRPEDSQIRATTALATAKPVSISQKPIFGERTTDPMLSARDSQTTPTGSPADEAAELSSIGDTSCAQDSLGELKSFSRKYSHDSTIKTRRLELLLPATYTRAYNRAYELGGLRGTSSTPKSAVKGDFKEKRRECTNDNCGMHLKGWTAEKTLFLAKTKLRREEQEIKEKLRQTDLEHGKGHEAKLKQEGLKQLEALEISFDQNVNDDDDSDWEDEDEVCIITGA